MIQRTFIALTIAIVSSLAAAQTPPIERLAPENSILIVGSKNLQSTTERIKRTPLWTLWQSDEIKKMRADVMEKMGEGLDKMFQELGVEKDSLVFPAGSVGAALFTVRDPELDTPRLSFLVMADYGNEATATVTDSVVMAALARGEKEGQLEFDQKDVGGRTIYTIDLSKLKQGAQFDDLDMGGGMPLPVPTPQEMFENVDKLHYVRNGNALMVCSDLTSLTDALDAGDGKGAGNRVSDRAEYQAIMNKVSEGGADADFYGVLLTRDIMDVLAADDPMGMALMMRSMARSLVGEVHGYGLGIRVDGPTAMFEQTVTAYMPKGKAGLTTLVDFPAPRPPLPSFVGHEAISYNNVTFRFAGLVDVLRQVIAANPMLQMQGAGQQLEEVAPMLNQVTAALGTQIHWATSSSQPFTAENRQTIFAIECTKPQDFENFLAPFAAQAGIEARDFLGQRIYSLPEGMAEMVVPYPGMNIDSLSLGIGGGFILVGPTPSVEQGLRATSQPGGASLSSNADFQRAVAALSRDGIVAWGFSDTVDVLESGLAVQRAQIEEAIKQMNEEGEFDDEFADQDNDEYAQQLRDSMKLWDNLDFPLFRRHIGPAVWQVQATDDGFVMRSYQFGAAGK